MANAAYAQTTLKVTLTPGFDVKGEPTYTATVQNTGNFPTVNLLVAIHPTNTPPQDVTAVATEAGGGTDSAFVTSTITAVGLTEMQVTMTSTNPGKVGEAPCLHRDRAQHSGR